MLHGPLSFPSYMFDILVSFHECNCSEVEGKAQKCVHVSHGPAVQFNFCDKDHSYLC